MTGHFFVIDGPEGAGKTTQIGMLREVLPHRYARPPEDFVFTREPGGTPLAEQIRNHVVLHDCAEGATGFELIQAYGAARFNHVRRRVRPALAAGKVVVCDRFDAITFAYQVVAQEGGERTEKLFELQRRELVPELFGEDAPVNWMTIILDVPVEVTIARVAARDAACNHFDRRPRAFYECARGGFQAYKRRYPVATKIIDAARTPALVHQDIIAVFDQVLGGPSPLA